MSKLFMQCRTKLLSTFRFEKRNVFIPILCLGENDNRHKNVTLCHV